jgi:DNA-binding NarL/FixJ family response regulator
MEKAKIVLFEDEDLIAEELCIILENNNYSVIGIHKSSDEAIDNINSLQPDLILMDIRLAGRLDGIQTSEEIKDYFDIPIIYVTAYADDLIIDRAKITEPYGYIMKPLNDRELFAVIEIALYKHKIDKKLKNRCLNAEYEDIVRHLKFSPEYYQSALSLLNYLSKYLNEKLPDESPKIEIGQWGDYVLLCIESPKNNKKNIEKKLFEFASLITNQQNISKILSNKIVIEEIQHHLKNVKQQLSSNLCLYNKLYEEKDARVISLEKQIEWLQSYISNSLIKSHEFEITNINHLIDKLLIDKNMHIEKSLLTIKDILDNKIPTDDDKQVFLSELANIKEKKPAVFKRIYDMLISSIISGGAGYWVKYIIDSIPK